MTQSDLWTCVLIVGQPRQLAELVVEALGSDNLCPILHADTHETALELTYAQRPGLIILDFSSMPTKADALADSLRAVDPNAWIIDFAGVLRRRPEHARVQMALTQPFHLEPFE